MPLSVSEIRSGRRPSLPLSRTGVCPNETLVFNHGGLIHGKWRRHRSLAGTHLLEECCHDLDLAPWFAASLPMRVASLGGCTFFRSENAFHATRGGDSPEGKPPFRSLHSNSRGISPFNDDKGIVDHQFALLEFANGVRASFHTQCLSAIPERRFYPPARRAGRNGGKIRRSARRGGGLGRARPTTSASSQKDNSTPSPENNWSGCERERAERFVRLLALVASADYAHPPLPFPPHPP